LSPRQVRYQAALYPDVSHSPQQAFARVAGTMTAQYTLILWSMHISPCCHAGGSRGGRLGEASVDVGF